MSQFCLQLCVMLDKSLRITSEKICEAGVQVLLYIAEHMPQGQNEMKSLYVGNGMRIKKN